MLLGQWNNPIQILTPECPSIEGENNHRYAHRNEPQEGLLERVKGPIKPEEAMSESRRSAANEWFDRSLYSQLNDKRRGVFIIIMQRLHVEDLAG